MRAILLSMLIGALFGGGMAIAQSSVETTQQGKKPHYLARFDEQFKAADTDGDGALTRAEAESAKLRIVIENFDRLDVNKDGKVTRDEMRALVRGRLSI